MHCLKILPLSPPSLRCPVIVCSSYQTVVSCHPPAAPILVLQPRSPPQPLRPALSRCHRSPRTLRAVIVVLVLWLVRETFSDLLLG